MASWCVGDDGTVRLTNPAATTILGGRRVGHYRDIAAALRGDRELPALGRAGGPVAASLDGEGETWIEVTTYPVADGRR